MGRLANTYDGRPIIDRISHTMMGRVDAVSLEQDVTFSSSAFIHNDKRPFEIHRFIPRVYEIDDNGAIVSDLGDAGLVLIYTTIHDFSQDQDLLKAPTTPLALTRGTQDRCWEWGEPYTLQRAEGFSARFNVVDLVGAVASERIRVMYSFQGHVLVQEGS